MDSSDNSLPEATGAADLCRPATVKRSQSAAASIGRIAVERAKPPLPPRRGIDYDVNGNIEPYRSPSRAVPAGAAVEPVVASTVPLAAMPSNAVATQKYFSLIRPTCFSPRAPGTTPSHSVIKSSKENRQSGDSAVPTEAPSKQTMRPSRPAPLPPKTPPTPQPRTLLSTKRLRCYSEPISDERHAEDIRRPASDNGTCASLETAAPQHRLPEAQSSSLEDIGVGSSSATVGTASDAPRDIITTAPVTLAMPTAPGKVYVFCKLKGVTFRLVRFVAPSASTRAEPKPDSLTDCELPTVVWHTDELTQSNCVSLVATTSKGNRSVEPLISTTLKEDEEEKEKGEEEENGDDYTSLHNCPVPLYPAPSRPSLFNESFCMSSDVAAYASYDNSDYVDPVTITSARAAHLSEAEAKEGSNQQKELAERRRKKEEKTKRRDEKRQKEEEKKRRTQAKAEKKEKDRREKDEQKRAAELQKLLGQYKVSITDPPLCEAIVNKDNLKPEKNELLVHAGERVFILAKDSKGKCLAKSSISRGNAIGIVASSNLLLAETERRENEKHCSMDDPDGIYEELGK